MIVKRQPGSKPKTPPRRIVRRRNQPVIGAVPPRRIVRRQRGGVIGGTRGGGGRRWHITLANARAFAIAGACSLVMLIAGTIGWWAWQSPLFRVGRFDVEGNSAISSETVVSTVGLYGDSMFIADLDAAEERLKALPLVADAEVTRAWPNSVAITIDEREPWGTWVQGGVPYAIDREGVVLGDLPVPLTAPVIRTADTLTLRPGDRVDYQAVDASAAIYERLPAALGTGINEVAYLSGQGVQVETSEGQVALFGDSSAIDYKLAVWAAVSDRAASEGISYTSIDLRYGNRPVLN